MISRFYFDGKLKKVVDLDREESRHVKVLRLKEGDEVELFDGKGTVSRGKIDVFGRLVKVQIFETRKEKREKRKLVIPGEKIVSGEDYLPGDFTRKEGKDIIRPHPLFKVVEGGIEKWEKLK